MMSRAVSTRNYSAMRNWDLLVAYEKVIIRIQNKNKFGIVNWDQEKQLIENELFRRLRKDEKKNEQSHE